MADARTLVFHEIEVAGYERVLEVVDEESGLHAIIALHSTRLGPALGGTRLWAYNSFDEALVDVLRLAKGMTYKASVSRTGSGGGKSVIIAKKGEPKTEKQLLAFAEAVNQLGGHYICAEDVGITPDDLMVIRKKTSYVVGLPHPKSSGDPSPFTAWGGFRGIQAVCKKLWGSDSVSNRRVAIQGLGAVGMKLAHTLFWHGAKLIVTDVDVRRVGVALSQFAAEVVAPEDIHRVECDIFSPCAMGGGINSATIPEIKAKAVAGVANNQLLHESDAELLKGRHILYAPDYVINSGGLLNVCTELQESGYNPASSRNQVDAIYDHLLDIFQRAQKNNQSTAAAADLLAEENLAKAIGRREKPFKFHH